MCNQARTVHVHYPREMSRLLIACGCVFDTICVQQVPTVDNRSSSGEAVIVHVGLRTFNLSTCICVLNGLKFWSLSFFLFFFFFLSFFRGLVRHEQQDRVFSAGEVIACHPTTHGNIHDIEAIDAPFAMLDVLIPPYSGCCSHTHNYVMPQPTQANHAFDLCFPH
jgi:hypothetical protein